ncbi:MAG TPA: hypothetical protein VNI01_07250 [Elusimicrobiota bacterium]|jgi:hypothetical protein|nr:hypothetical protein [Elusimicrobiota bacterium]
MHYRQFVVLWAALGARLAGAACDFAALDSCPLDGNRSARFAAVGTVDVAYQLSAVGGLARFYLLSEVAFAEYSATGAAVPLADTCPPSGFASCAGSVGVTVPDGALVAVLDANGSGVRVSGSVTVVARAATGQPVAVAVAVAAAALAAVTVIALVAWVLWRARKRAQADAP